MMLLIVYSRTYTFGILKVFKITNLSEIQKSCIPELESVTFGVLKYYSLLSAG